MTRRYIVVTALALLGGSACQPVPESQSREVPDELAQYVLADVPQDLEQRTLIDFEGKAHLVGYEINPTDPVTPGSRMRLTLYWESVSPLGPGWSLFTHLIDDQGNKVENKVRGDGGFDNIGPLRKRSGPDGDQAFPPSLWTPGKVYQDVQAFRLPRTVQSTQLTVLVGIGRDLPAASDDTEQPPPEEAEGAGGAGPIELPSPEVRLAIVSGPSDGNNRGIVGHVQTTWKPSDKPPKKANAGKGKRGRRHGDKARRGGKRPGDRRLQGGAARHKPGPGSGAPSPMKRQRPARPHGPPRGAPAAPPRPAPPAPPSR